MPVTMTSETTRNIGGREIPIRRVQTVFTKPSLTQQHFKKECDIEHIVKTARKTGMLPQQIKTPQYGDLKPLTYLDHLNTISKVKSYFESLPAKTRSRFNNKPENLLEFLDNPENKDEAIRLKLMPTPEKTPEQKAAEAAVKPATAT